MTIAVLGWVINVTHVGNCSSIVSYQRKLMPIEDVAEKIIKVRQLKLFVSYLEGRRVRTSVIQVWGETSQ